MEDLEALRGRHAFWTRWALFGGASLLTWTAYKTLWATDWYWIYLSLLGTLSAGLAIAVLRQAGFRFLPVAGVIVGLLVGQWWFVQAVILQLFWRVGGMAP